MHAAAPLHMALGQLYTNKIQDKRLLAAMVSIPREAFVPKVLANAAYTDAPIALHAQRALLAPLTQAEMLDAAQLSSTDNVLILPAGSGYLACVAAKLASTIVALESDEALAKQAKNLCAKHHPKLRIEQVTDVLAGYVEHAPYDAILIEGALQALPQALIAQLKPNGRLVYARPIGTASAGVVGSARLCVATLTPAGFALREISECAAPQLKSTCKNIEFVL